MVRTDLEEKRQTWAYSTSPMKTSLWTSINTMLNYLWFFHHVLFTSFLDNSLSGSARPCSFFLFHTLSMHTCPVSHVQLFATPWSPARLLCQWNFPGKKYWSGLPFLLQRIFPTQESNLCLLRLPCLFTTVPPGKLL